jgi:hypothetical protein
LNSLHSRLVCVVKADAEKFWEKVTKNDIQKKNFEKNVIISNTINPINSGFFYKKKELNVLVKLCP